MRKLLKVFEFKDTKYVFDGSSLELYKITNEEDFAEYVKDEDEFTRKKQFTNKDSISKIVLNVSNECNLNCKYCYADGGKYASKKKWTNVF
ncbi:MAG: hypothetical protein RSD97_08885 [Lachnospiraceae bacterium]